MASSQDIVKVASVLPKGGCRPLLVLSEIAGEEIATCVFFLTKLKSWLSEAKSSFFFPPVLPSCYTETVVYRKLPSEVIVNYDYP